MLRIALPLLLTLAACTDSGPWRQSVDAADAANQGEVPSSPPGPFDRPDAPLEPPIDCVDADLTVADMNSDDGTDVGLDVVVDGEIVDVIVDLADSSGYVAGDSVGFGDGDGDGDVNVNVDGLIEVMPELCEGVAVGCQGTAWLTCDPETGVFFAAICTDLDPCFDGACVADIGCVETPVDCSDGDPCTVDSCTTLEGCLHEPVECPDGQLCDSGACVVTYPPPPHGGYPGDVVANHGFTNPADLSQVTLSEWWGDGQLLLLTFSAGWCIVCKNDVAVFNEWLGNCWDDGLRVVEVLYENPDQTPATASYANGWVQAFDAQYPVLIDNATLGADGEAEGGVLESFLLPNGPGEEGYMPIPVLIDTATMEIVFADTGMNKPLFHALIKNHLGVNTCWDSEIPGEGTE